MATYQTILPPPQSVDSLDAWGGLDALQWSLDSGVWLRAGVYGILAAESAESAESLKKWTRIRTSDLLQGVAAGGEAEGNIIRDLVISDTAHMDGDQVGGVARAIPIAPIHGQSGEFITPYRIRDDVAQSHIQTGATFTPYRVRTDYPESTAQSTEHIIIYRLLTLFASGSSASGESLLPEYKGWAWDDMPKPDATSWNALETGQNDWNQIPGGNSRWRGVVEWQ